VLCKTDSTKWLHLYAKPICKDALRMFTVQCGNKSTSQLRSLGEMEVKKQVSTLSLVQHIYHPVVRSACSHYHRGSNSDRL